MVVHIDRTSGKPTISRPVGSTVLLKPQGVAVPAEDVDVAAHVANSVSATRAALSATYVAWENVRKHGAKGNGKSVNDGVTTAGSATLTSASAPFAASDVGKTILVYGAAAVGSNAALKTTIAGFTDASTVTLAIPAVEAASATPVVWGDTDDTAAVQAAFDGPGNVVFIPEGVYLVTSLSLPLGKAIVADTALSYTNVPSRGARLVCSNPAQTTAVLTVNGYNRLSGLAVIGSGYTNHSVVKINTGRCTFEHCTLARGNYGIDFNYTGGNHVVACMMHESFIGWRNPVDSTFIGSYVNVQKNDGISLQTGANDNTFQGIKVEWNDGKGINIFSAKHNQFSGFVIDRNGKAGLSAVSAQLSSLAQSIVRRNGRLSSGTANDDCHFYLQDCTQFEFLGVTTAAGVNDDSTGYNSPLTVIRRQSNTDVTFTACHLGGGTGATLDSVIVAGTNVRFVACSGLPGISNLTTMRAIIGTGTTGSIAAAGTGTLTFAGDAVGTFATGVEYTLKIWARNTTTASRRMAEVPVLVSRESGNASVALGAVVNQVGTDWGAGTGVLQVTASVNTDGTSITFTVTNTSANTQQVSGRLV